MDNTGLLPSRSFHFNVRGRHATNQPQSILHLQLKTKSLDTSDRKQRIPARNRLHFMENMENKAIIMNKRGFNRQRSVGQHSRVREQRDKSIVREPSAFFSGWRGRHQKGYWELYLEGRVGPDWWKPCICNKLESNSMSRKKTWYKEFRNYLDKTIWCLIMVKTQPVTKVSNLGFCLLLTFEKAM